MYCIGQARRVRRRLPADHRAEGAKRDAARRARDPQVDAQPAGATFVIRTMGGVLSLGGIPLRGGDV